MSLIVDTYNVLHRWRSGPLGGDGEDLVALSRLIARSRFAGGRIRLVCDGVPPQSGMPAVAPPVELLYAGPGGSADDLIERFVLDDSAPRRLTVVSSDRRVVASAHRRGASTIDSDSFLAHIIKDASAVQKAPLERDTLLDDRAIDGWLRTLDVSPDLLGIPSAAPKLPPSEPRPTPPPSLAKPHPTTEASETDADAIRRALGGEGRTPGDDDLDMERWLREGPKPPAV